MGKTNTTGFIQVFRKWPVRVIMHSVLSAYQTYLGQTRKNPFKAYLHDIIQSTDHINIIMLYQFKAVCFCNFKFLDHYFSQILKEILQVKVLKCANQGISIKFMEMSQIHFLQLHDYSNNQIF